MSATTQEPGTSQVLIDSPVAASNGLMHPESTQDTPETMADQRQHVNTADRTQMPTPQVDERIQLQAIAPADFIQPVDM